MINTWTIKQPLSFTLLADGQSSLGKKFPCFQVNPRGGKKTPLSNKRRENYGQVSYQLALN